MKIGCVLDSLSRNAGGLFQSVRRLAQSLAAADASVEVFGIEDENTGRDAADWRPLRVHQFKPATIQSWGYSSALVPALLEVNLDVLLAHGLWKYSSLASHRWHRRTGRPYIIHPHGMLDPWAVQNAKWKKRLAYLLYERTHLRHASCLRALCDSEAESIRAFGLSNPICVIPNGVDLPDGSISRLAPWSSNLGSRKVLLYLGRLHPKKNLPALLAGWKAVQASSPQARDWVLVIAGWDQNNHEARLRKQAGELGLEDSVHFAGPLFGDQKAGAYQNAEAFVLPSLSEGLPMVVLEAWAFGKPVVMTPDCNLPEGFAAGAAISTGKNADAIEDALHKLFEMDAAERTAMGERGHALVSEKFLWPRMAHEMKDVCEWVVGGGPVPASVRMN
jgi:glycosyltransferase involved in cell wall biosynthesis